MAIRKTLPKGELRRLASEVSRVGVKRASAERGMCSKTVARLLEEAGMYRPLEKGRQPKAQRAAKAPSPKEVKAVIGQDDEMALLRKEAKERDTLIKKLTAEALGTKAALKSMLGLAAGVDLDGKGQPAWTVEVAPKRSGTTDPGIPTLLCSDWHFGERVDPAQIGGVNEYDMDIARRRVLTLTSKTINLLDNHTVGRVRGIVVPLLGDMITGDIHEELRATNDVPTLEAFVGLFDSAHAMIASFAEHYGRVFVPCASGNHGRLTQKIQCKDRNATNLDWLLYTMLAKKFADDERVRFSIPAGPEVEWSVLGHRYLGHHGDRARGGDGMIGFIGPVKRMDHKLRSLKGQIGASYDTQLLGHFHQYLMTTRYIANGSLVGYNEYALANAFEYEPPQQALWMTTEVGPTISMPVFCDEKFKTRKMVDNREWASWAA